MVCKENYRRVMATCVRNVYDNDEKILYTLASGPLDVEALGFSLSSLWGNQALLSLLPKTFKSFSFPFCLL
jgi:hypothetical protein